MFCECGADLFLEKRGTFIGPYGAAAGSEHKSDNVDQSVIHGGDSERTCLDSDECR